MKFTVRVHQGRGAELVNDDTKIKTFTDEKRAREHYLDMLMMFPLYKVELLKHEL